MTRQTMTDEEFEKYFDEGGDTTAFMVTNSIRQPNKENEQKRVNLNMPAWLVNALDAKARRLGVNRQSLINITLAESLK